MHTFVGQVGYANRTAREPDTSRSLKIPLGIPYKGNPRAYSENLPDVQHIEGLIPRTYGSDAIEIPGSRALLNSLVKAGAPWAIVTSGTRPLLTGWLDVMKLAKPENLVVAEDVKQGKPDPEGYRLGHSRLKLPKEAAALVFEDAPAGVRAGKAAGFKVVALATTHDVGQLKAARADWIVKDMQSITLGGYDKKTGEIRVEISNALVG